MSTTERLQTFWSTAVWYLGGAAAIQALNLLAQPVFALFLTPSQWGVTATYLFWMTVFGVLIGFQAQAAVNNVRTTYGEDELSAYIATVMPWYVLPTGLLLGVLALAPGRWSNVLGLSPGYLTLAILNGLLFAITAMGMARAVALGLRQRFVGLSLGSTVLPIIVGLVLVAVLDDDAQARIWGYLLGTALVVVVLALGARRARPMRRRELLRFGVILSLPLLAHELLYLVMNQSNRVFLTTLVDEHAAGVFAFAFSLGNAAVVAATAVNSGWTPWYFENTKAGETARVRRTGAELLLGFGAAITAAALVSPEGLRLIAPGDYEDGARVLPALLVAGHLVLVFNVAANHAIFVERTRSILAVSAVGAVFSVVLNVMLVPRLDIVGAAVAALAATAWLATAMTVVSVVTLGCRNLSLPAAVASTALTAAGLAVTWLAFDHAVIRFAVAGIVVAGLVVALVRRLRARRLVDDPASTG